MIAISRHSFDVRAPIAVVLAIAMSASGTLAAAAELKIEGQSQKSGSPPNLQYSAKGIGNVDVPAADSAWTIDIVIEREVPGTANAVVHTVQIGGKGSQKFDTDFKKLWDAGKAPTTGADTVVLRVSGSYTSNGVKTSFAEQKSTMKVTYP